MSRLHFRRTGPEVNEAILKMIPINESMYDISFYSYKFGRIDLNELPKQHPANISSDERSKFFGNYNLEHEKIFRQFFSPIKKIHSKIK